MCYSPFQLPHVCSYQSINYTVILWEVEASAITHRLTNGPFNGTVRSDDIVFSEGLHLDKTYRITVKFDSGFHPALVIRKDICKKAIIIINNVTGGWYINSLKPMVWFYNVDC